VTTVICTIISIRQAKKTKRYKSDFKKLYEGEELTRFIDHAHVVLTNFYVMVRNPRWGRGKNVDKDIEEVSKLLMDANKHIYQIGGEKQTEVNGHINSVKSYINVVDTMSENERIEQSDVVRLLDKCLQKVKQGHINNLLK
jgi:hypothetical protein